MLHLVLTFTLRAWNLNKCKEYMEKHTPILLKAFIPLLLFTFIIGCLILPILLKKLRGHSSAYFFLQQLFAILYLSLTFIPLYLSLTFIPLIFEHKITTKSSNSAEYGMGFSRYDYIIMILIPFLDFLKNVFHYQYYLFSLLLSLHYDSMICKPMLFKEYISLKNVLCRVLYSSILSILLSLDDFIAFLNRAFILVPSGFRVKVIQNMIVIYSVKLVLIKVAQTVALAIIACKIKNALNSSQNIRNQDRKDYIPALFIVVCLIPLFNTLLHWCSDIPIIFFKNWISHSLNYYLCDTTNLEFDYMHLPLSVSSYLLGSILQCISYLISFPQLRTGPCLKQK